MAIKQPNIAPFDSDAQKFILAADLSRFADKVAINHLVTRFKSNGLWTLFNAIYPMVGGNSWSCSFNLKNPIHSDGAFRLTFTANPLISYNGVDWDGTTQYANTHLFANTLSGSSNHLSYYSRENTQLASDLDMGVNSGAAIMTLCCGRSSDNLLFYEQGGWYANVASAAISRAGFFVGTRTIAGATNPILYRNGVSIQTAITADGTSATPPALEFILGAQNSNGTPTVKTNRQCAFASIGSGFTAAQAFVFNQIVQQFQIILNRAV